MLYGKANIFASEVAPNPKEVTYWADLRADSYGKVIKVFVDGKWEPIIVTNTSESGEISYELLKNKPTINGVILQGNVTLKSLGIQSVEELDNTFVNETELTTMIDETFVSEEELLTDVYTKEQVDEIVKNNSSSNNWIEV